MPTAPKVGGRNWKAARAGVTRHVAQAARTAALIRQAAHLQVAQELAADVAVALAAALAEFNDLVAIVEVNDGSE